MNYETSKTPFRINKEKQMLKAKIGLAVVIALFFLSGFSGAFANTSPLPTSNAGSEVRADADVIDNGGSDKPKERRSSSGGGYNKTKVLKEIIRLLEIKLELLRMLNLR